MSGQLVNMERSFYTYWIGSGVTKQEAREGKEGKKIGTCRHTTVLALSPYTRLQN